MTILTDKITKEIIVNLEETGRNDKSIDDLVSLKNIMIELSKERIIEKVTYENKLKMAVEIRNNILIKI